MEANKAVLFFHQEENDSRDPGKHIAQTGCYVLIHAHRSWTLHGRSILRLTVLLAWLTVLLAAIWIGGLWWWSIAAVLAWLIWILSLIAHDTSLSLFTNIRPQ